VLRGVRFAFNASEALKAQQSRKAGCGRLTIINFVKGQVPDG
jgi:hypothetical protein